MKLQTMGRVQYASAAAWEREGVTQGAKLGQKYASQPPRHIGRVCQTGDGPLTAA